MREGDLPIVLSKVLSKKTDMKYWNHSSQVCQMKVILNFQMLF